MDNNNFKDDKEVGDGNAADVESEDHDIYKP